MKESRTTSRRPDVEKKGAPLPASLVQLVFEHQDLLLQRQLVALGVTQLLVQRLQLGAMLRLPARQLLLVQERLLLQVPPEAAHLLGLVRRGRGSGGAGLLQLGGVVGGGGESKVEG